MGEVSIDFDDGKIASIVYVVFPTRTDALANFADALKVLETQKGVKVERAAPDLPKPFIMLRLTGGITGVTLW